MSETATNSTADKTPWHIWVVAILSLLWDGSGAITIWMAQAGRLTTMDPGEIEYYANQALWFQLVTDIALVAPLAAAITLCLRNKAAVWLFGVGLGAIAITNTYDVLAGSSRVLVSTGALVVTGIIIVLAILQLIYARSMHQRGILR